MRDEARVREAIETIDAYVEAWIMARMTGDDDEARVAVIVRELARANREYLDALGYVALEVDE